MKLRQNYVFTTNKKNAFINDMLSIETELSEMALNIVVN